MKALIHLTALLISVTAISQSNNSRLGEYLSINQHPKAKGVNLKIKVPIGWNVVEGERPNTVKLFKKNTSTYVILIKDNETFFSRKQYRDAISNKEVLNDIVEESISFLKKPKLINHSVITLDNYPAIQFKAEGILEQMGYTKLISMIAWIIYYEDKFIFLQAQDFDKEEFKNNEQIFTLITNSIIFPEQYD